MVMDILTLDQEQLQPGAVVFDPTNPSRYKAIPENLQLLDLRQLVMQGGKRLGQSPPLAQLADHCAAQLQALPQGSLRLINPHRYKVSMSPELHILRQQLLGALSP
jgi:nicotinate phosphoribosyltransferase